MRQQELADKDLTLVEHLEELRMRLIWSLLVVAAATMLCFFISKPVLDVLNRPVTASSIAQEPVANPLVLLLGEGGALSVKDPASLGTLTSASGFAIEDAAGARVYESQPRRRVGLQYIRPLDPVLLHFKASLILGLALSFPFVLVQVWRFVAPGLLPAERRFALPTILSGCLLFPVGATFAYFMLDFMLAFAARFTPADAVIFPDARAWLSFALTMMLAFGLVFELPLAVVLAVRVGVVSVDTLEQKRKVVFLAILVVAALITPPDGITMLIVAAPVYLLFEASLLVCRSLERAAGRRDALPEAGAS